MAQRSRWPGVLTWSYPGQGTEIVPQRYLYPRTAALGRGGWTASASHNGGSAVAAIDSNPDTRWDTSLNQSSANGAWFQVDMQSSRTFSAINLNTVNSTGDQPGSYTVSVSQDGNNWSQVATGSSVGPMTTAVFSPQTARYIRVTLGSTSVSLWWSIHEFHVFNYNNGFNY